jgi:hypothetical protein
VRIHAYLVSPGDPGPAGIHVRSKRYTQMHAITRIAIDNALHQGANRWARRLASPGLKPLPDFAVPSVSSDPLVSIGS